MLWIGVWSEKSDFNQQKPMLTILIQFGIKVSLFGCDDEQTMSKSFNTASLAYLERKNTIVKMH